MLSVQERIREREGRTYIFDAIRKKEVVLTPEEWVRQQLIFHVVTQRNYPEGNLSVEKMIRLGEKQKRYDLLVYHRGSPWLLLECKEENIPINKATLQQALSYVSSMKVEYLVLSNGHQVFCYHLPTQQWEQQFPNYPL